MSHSSPQTIPAQPWQEPTSACPPRFWWLQRGSILFVVTLLALVGLRWWWGKIADDRLAAMIAEAHARGEPILPEDFNPAPIPDSQNAALTLRLAADSIVRDATYDAFEKNWDGAPLAPAALPQLEHILSANQKSLKLCHLARSQSGVNWNIPVKTPVFAMPLPHLSAQRALAMLQTWAALSCHYADNDAEAIDEIEDVLRQASAIDLGPSCAVTHLVAIGISAEAVSRLQSITPDLQIDSAGDRRAKSHSASLRQVHSLISHLLDENELQLSVVRSFEGERMVALDTATFMAKNDRAWVANAAYLGIEFCPRTLLAPMIEFDGMQLAQTMQAVSVAAKGQNFPTAQSALPAHQHRVEVSDADLLCHRFRDTFAIWYDRSVESHYKYLTEQRATAIALAIRLYRFDHSGQLPPLLENLVPDYLPRVPADPMAANIRPFQYRPDRRPAILYSVGRNGIDDGGTPLPSTLGSKDWRAADAVYPLEPLPPESQPSAQTQDHQ